MRASGGIHFVVIDGQNDFCDLPAGYRPVVPSTEQAVAPALPVPGAHDDMRRTARLIETLADTASSITLTLDTHFFHIATTAFWRDGRGAEVPPFTEITADMVRRGDYLPAHREHLERAVAYMEMLEAAGRYRLVAWPVHCRAGSWGANVHSDVEAAVSAWERDTGRYSQTFLKGMNMFREHYSAVRAEVLDPADAATDTNHAFVQALAGADTIIVTGEAASHCVRGTVLDLTSYIQPERFVLVSDCMSAVPGCQAAADSFLELMRANGARVLRSAEVGSGAAL